MHYNQQDIEQSLKDIGIKKGNILFSHMNLGFFGIAEGGMTEDNLFEIFYNAIFNVIGQEGVLIVPTFTYSFTSDEKYFDVDNTISKMGFFAEKLRKLPNSIRTNEPMFSVAIAGNIKKIFPDRVVVSDECFGKNSIWDIMYKNNAKICNFNFDAGSTYIHYVEKMHNVDYRFDKEFFGVTKVNSINIERAVTFFCRKLEYIPDFTKFDKYVKENNIAKTCKLGRGIVLSISCEDTYNTFTKLYEKDKNIMIEKK